MLNQGDVVWSAFGHDKHRYYVVIEADAFWVTIADGKGRTLEKPKRKNRKHVSPTKTKLDLSIITSNKRLKKELEPLNSGLARGEYPKGGK